MTTQICTNLSLPSTHSWLSHRNPSKDLQIKLFPVQTQNLESLIRIFAIRCSAKPTETFRTCKNCKTQFDPSLNHPRACRHHTAHFGGETKRKFESVYTGGTMNSPDSGKVFQYWHCCGSEDPFDPGCTAAPHSSYDD
ncbi:hypothetical protein RJ639_010371 [Escallonia herrerae]|uniref:Uncharacterized protein n=1 Tax=Escallonia herrerae TaxID=1293975 RepID=A0AA88V7I0_9ASTE|nr:hypothetical protein RJ639_018887 [Escallonia herrerae]KAK3012448.1 hypothetical protein RJ639_010371 [Escallonia herrerae]